MTIAWNREKNIKSLGGIVLLFLAFLLLYEPWRLGARELFRLEGFYAAQTQEIDWAMPIVTAHGVAIQNAYPLYPLLCSLLQKLTGLPVEFAMRLVSVLMTLATATIIYITTKLSRNTVAAQAATAMFLSCNIVVEKSLDAYPTSTIAFGILAAQLLWFYFGVRRANWHLAWLSGLAVMAPTFYAGGFQTLLLFFFPLIFMRRPLTIWAKLNKAGFYAGVLVLLLAISAWGVPYIVNSDELPFQYWGLGSTTFLGYLEQLITVPLDCIIRFLPWTLIAWAPFCVALHPLDDTPIYSRYLRTITISSFFLFWLLPDTEIFELVYLAGPLAILTGLHYEIAVRRYSRQIRLLLKSCGLFTLAVTVAILLFCLLPEHWFGRYFISISNPITFRHAPEYVALALSTAAATLLATLILLTGNRRNPVWGLLLLTSVCGGFFYWFVMFPYRAQEKEKQRFGAELRHAMLAGPDAEELPSIVYKSNILDLYGECRYMDIKVRKIDNLSELPKEEDTVYLLNTEFPQLPERNWTSLLPPDHTYLRHRVRLWRGELRKNNPPNPQTEW